MYNSEVKTCRFYIKVKYIYLVLFFLNLAFYLLTIYSHKYGINVKFRAIIIAYTYIYLYHV